MAVSNNTINIGINVKDNATNNLKQIGQQLKEMGERVRFIGTGFTAMFTAPVVGGLALLAKSGSDAARQVNALQQQINEAVSAGDIEKVKALNQQMDALPENVRRSARAWNDLQAALQPANDALNEAKTTMLEALVPLVRELAPLLTKAAQGVASLAEKFSSLPIGVQKTIVGIIGLAAAIGPALMILGQLMGMVGSAAQLLGMAGIGVGGAGAAAGGASLAGAAATAGGAITSFGAAVAAAVAPIGLLVGAILLLKQVLQDFGPQAATTARQLMLLASLKTGLIDRGRFLELSQYYGLTGRASGGSVIRGRPVLVGERGPEIFAPDASGMIIPNERIGANTSGGTIVINYRPMLSTASTDEIETFGRYVRQAIRRSP